MIEFGHKDISFLGWMKVIKIFIFKVMQVFFLII